MARILAVGNATLDIINVVDSYPSEDQELRARAQHIVRGGNATNTLVVLSQLGHDCAWAGTLADEPDARSILSDLESHRIDTSAVHTAAEGKVPTSYVTLSQASGSRTIIHHRDLDEYSHHDFANIDLSGLEWIHFEGRNLKEVERMLERVKHEHPELPISIEVEKPRPGIERLFHFADLLLFSRDYARAHGYHHADEFLGAMAKQSLTATLSCTWGDAGAWLRTAEGVEMHAPAFPPPMTVDTLGAGDVFNAGIINALVGKEGLESALVKASRLAGKKCGVYGLNGLAD